jgi:transposase
MAGRKASKITKPTLRARRQFDREFKEQAVRMMLDGHSASTVATNLGIDNPNLVYRWKKDLLQESGVAATTLDARVRELQEKLQRVERERDILKKALAIFSRQT